MAPTYPMVQYNLEIFSKWYARFGAKLTLLMDQVIVREWMNTGGASHIFLSFNGNPDDFSEGATLNAVCLRKPKEIPNLLGRLMGEEATPRGRLIVFTATNATA